MEPKDDLAIPEKIPKRRVIVYKTSIDPTVIKLAVEKIKNELFVKMGFLKPKPENIQYVSIDKYYEPFIFLDGKYSVDYFRKFSFNLQVDDDTEEIVILGKKFKPKIVEDPEKGTYGIITLEAEKHFSHEKKENLILDKDGREVPLESMPFAPSEENSKKIFEEYKDNIEDLQIPPDKDIEILRSKIVQRPEKMGRMGKELFKVSERVMIYTPIYKITFQNTKTGEKKIVKMDGVTAKIQMEES